MALKVNPILKRELRVQGRSYMLPLLVTVINIVLFLAGLMGVFGAVTRMRMSSESEYGTFLRIYAVVVMIEFVLLSLLTPSLTAGAIAGERQTKTLDLMLTTQMKPSELVCGKLAASLWELVVVICSCLPAMLLPLMYGGVRVVSVISLLLLFIPEALFLLCIGIFASSMSGSVARTTALAYAMLGAVCAGTPVIAFLCRAFASGAQNYSAYLLVFNPLLTIAACLAEQLGETQQLLRLAAWLRFVPDPALIRFFVPLSVLAQGSLAFVLALAAVQRITPQRGTRRLQS